MNPYPEALTHGGCGIVRRDSYVNSRIFISNILVTIYLRYTIVTELKKETLYITTTWYQRGFRNYDLLPALTTDRKGGLVSGSVRNNRGTKIVICIIAQLSTRNVHGTDQHGNYSNTTIVRNYFFYYNYPCYFFPAFLPVSFYFFLQMYTGYFSTG